MTEDFLFEIHNPISLIFNSPYLVFLMIKTYLIQKFPSMPNNRLIRYLWPHQSSNRNLKIYNMYVKGFLVRVWQANDSHIIIREGGGCGRFWNLPILEICSLYNWLSRILFCMVRDKCMLLIIPKRNFYLIFKIAT